MPLYIKCSGNAGATFQLTSRKNDDVDKADFFLQNDGQFCGVGEETGATDACGAACLEAPACRHGVPVCLWHTRIG